MRMFKMVRDIDETGISGTGVVAEGIEFSDGRVALRWQTGDHNSTVIWDNIESVHAIHGHNGKTRVVFVDEGQSGSDRVPEPEEISLTQVIHSMIAELDKAVNGTTFARNATPQAGVYVLLEKIRSANQ